MNKVEKNKQIKKKRPRYFCLFYKMFINNVLTGHGNRYVKVGNGLFDIGYFEEDLKHDFENKDAVFLITGVFELTKEEYEIK